MHTYYDGAVILNSESIHELVAREGAIAFFALVLL